ncbi:tripartite tricarboxylate transporter substrate binding protein [Roseomonas sp. 18066]|uniref:Bug family tripartite tricarboxylate transporter substrate binding protein n=1 Tax=Roseomonas sp. 18066 TaxID=2681412 RepID=UPI00135A457D|nr:tripartite tricarboxylate transporter substrate binding protein [Roseomonas sp. 18066]
MPHRRDLLRTALLAMPALQLARAAAAAAPAAAQPRFDTLRLFVPAAPGGGWDGTARLMERVLRQTQMAGNVQVENVPGAGGAVALPRFVGQMRGRADTLMVSGLTQLSAVIVNKSPVSLAQTTPIARLLGETHVLVVPQESPIRSLQDFVAAFRAEPKAMAVAGGSAGGSDHILLAMMAARLGIPAGAISYVAFSGGGPAVTAIVGNQVRAGISNWSEFQPHVETGRMRALGLSSDDRLAGVEVPTLREGGVDAVLYNWRAVFAPPRISEDEAARLESLVKAMVDSPEWKGEAEKRGWLPIYLARADFTAFLAEEAQRVGETLQQLGLAS